MLTIKCFGFWVDHFGDVWDHLGVKVELVVSEPRFYIFTETKTIILCSVQEVS